jgi:hypothetical protein
MMFLKKLFLKSGYGRDGRKIVRLLIQYCLIYCVRRGMSSTFMGLEICKRGLSSLTGFARNRSQYCMQKIRSIPSEGCNYLSSTIYEPALNRAK